MLQRPTMVKEEFSMVDDELLMSVVDGLGSVAFPDQNCFPGQFAVPVKLR